MIRQLIKIDEDICNGCGLCVSACHEGAIGLVGGKAKLLRDDYCDGLGNCLPACPAGAISFEQREALAFNEDEVKKNMESRTVKNLPCGCPGTHAKENHRKDTRSMTELLMSAGSSQLNQWPVQIKLVPVNAPYFENAKLLVAADCTCYAYDKFHNDFMRNKITIIGCPKLDEGNYSEKLTEILKNNTIKSVTAIRMEVPCCCGIENAVKTALHDSGKMIPWQVVTITTDGKIFQE